MKLILLGEGHTEKVAIPSFLRRWLDPRVKRPIAVKPVLYQGSSDLITKARLNLAGRRSGDVIGVVGLMDLYGTTLFPSHLTPVAAKCKWGKRHFERKVGHPRFKMHFAVHEIEAWLLSEPAIFPQPVQTVLRGLAGQPEDVDFAQPPAKRLARAYRDKLQQTYDKRLDGRLLFDRLKPDVAAAKCPYLKLFLDDVLALARAAGL